jgi:hypothetical protein
VVRSLLHFSSMPHLKEWIEAPLPSIPNKLQVAGLVIQLSAVILAEVRCVCV